MAIILLLLTFFSMMSKGQDTIAIRYVREGTSYYARGNWEEALRSWFRAQSFYSKQNDETGESMVLDTIAGKYYQYGLYKKSAEYYEKEFLLCSKDDLKKMAAISEMVASSYYYLPVDSLSANWFNYASEYYASVSDTAGYLRCIEKLASVYLRQGIYNMANEKYRILQSAYMRKRDFRNFAVTCNQVGFLLFKKQQFNEALEAFSTAVTYSEKSGRDDFFLTDVYSNLAICHQNMGLHQEMLIDFRKALQSAKNSGRIDEAARIERILATIYFRKGDNYHAELYCLSCIESAGLSRNFDILQLCYRDYSEVLEKGNDFVKALEYYEKYLSLRDSLAFIAMIREKEEADLISSFDEAEQRIKFDLADEEIRELEIKTLRAESSRRENALKLLIKQRELDRSEKERLAQSLVLEQEKNQVREKEQQVKSLEQQRLIQQLEIKRKDDEAIVLQKTNEALEKDKMLKDTELRNEKFARKMAVWLGILMVLVALSILLGLLSVRKKNIKLADSKREIEKINSDLELKNVEVLKQNEKIRQQKDIIEQKNQSITDSIQYASRIQSAVLPPVDFLSEWGFDNFILYKPKDIVSGDFYWGSRKEDKIIIAAGDCTGHGVPGAFMSMLGHAFLDEIVNTIRIKNAAMILNVLRDEIIGTLKQKGNIGEARDGMDISLIIFYPGEGKIDFAGANNPVYLIRERELKKIQGDRMPIGIHAATGIPFSNQSMKIKKGDCLYLFSDGFADQFGGVHGKKFMYKPFQELLIGHHIKPMHQQKEILDSTFEEWKGHREQVDDVLVIGMRF